MKLLPERAFVKMQPRRQDRRNEILQYPDSYRESDTTDDAMKTAAGYINKN